MMSTDLDHAAKLAVVKIKCENDFEFFVRYFFKHQKGSKFVFSWHHKRICDELMKVYRGEVTNLIINMPPRYSKTEIVVKMFSAWCMVKNPRSEFIHLSYSDPLALDNSETVKAVIKSKEFQELWPLITIKNNKDSKKAWGTEQGGVFYATAAGGSVTGFGAGRIDEFDDGKFKFSGAIIADDPLKPDDARSNVKRESINRRWDETIKSRRNSKHTPVIIIMQRLHEMDFCGMLLSDTELKWSHLVLPAILREGSDDEEALWPAKHSLEDLRKMKAKNPYMFAGQMQQQPTPEGGGKIKREYWNFYEDHAEVMGRCSMFFWVADTAYTAKTSNDPSVFSLWGCEGGNRLYLLDRRRGWWEFPELVRETQQRIAKYQVNNGIYIEAKASGLSLIQSLRQKGVKAIPWKPKDYAFPDDKVGRVNESMWPIANGDVWLPDDGVVNSVTGEVIDWSDDWVGEHERFTTDDTHMHDDMVDNTTMAVSIWQYYSRQ